MTEHNPVLVAENARIAKAIEAVKWEVIHDLYKKRDVQGLLALNYGTNTYGKKHVQLANDALAALGSPHKVTPGQKLASHPALIGGSGQPKTQSTPAGEALKAKAETVAAAATPAAGKPAVRTGPIPATKLPAKAAYQSYSSPTQKLISYIQSSSAVNHAFREGSKTFGGVSLRELTKAAYKDATAFEDGDTFFRYQSMPSGMLKQMESAKPGIVFQATGPMCCSYDETATSHFGNHKLIIRATKDSRALMSYGSGQFASEKEISTLPGQRFVMLDKKKVGQNWEIEVLMLPPDPDFPDSV